MKSRQYLVNVKAVWVELYISFDRLCDYFSGSLETSYCSIMYRTGMIKNWTTFLECFLKMCKNLQKCLKTSWKSTEWGTKIWKFPENSHVWKEKLYSEYFNFMQSNQWKFIENLNFDFMMKKVMRSIVLFIMVKSHSIAIRPRRYNFHIIQVWNRKIGSGYISHCIIYYSGHFIFEVA